jgi:hypothetical protein
MGGIFLFGVSSRHAKANPTELNFGEVLISLYEGVGPPKKSKDPPLPFPPWMPQEKTFFFTLFTRITQLNVPRVSGGLCTWVGAGWEKCGHRVRSCNGMRGLKNLVTLKTWSHFCSLGGKW